jgi:malate dehydrogenase (oxaloacetate-decarboxylating)
MPWNCCTECCASAASRRRRRSFTRWERSAEQSEFGEKWRVCSETNSEGLSGGIREALRGADICIAFSCSEPSLIKPEWVRAMARNAIVFACANPLPEIWPWEAKEAGARIVATGRGDFPNQINNSLVFPAIFRGALDVRARTITDRMALAAAHELARCAEERGLHDEWIVPRMDDWEIVPRVAAAAAMTAQEQGVARLAASREQLLERAFRLIRAVRQSTELLMQHGIIPPAPSAGLTKA